MPQTLSARAAHVHEQSTFVQAAVLAAHAARARTEAFRPGEVRFFFLLFTNWVEHDVTRPGQDIDLTQVRRALDRLVALGWAKRPRAARSKVAERSAGYALTPLGLVGLAESLADTRRSFEESVFVLGFASCYRRAIVARIESTTAARARVSSLLAPARLLAVARRRAAEVAADLDERVQSSRVLEKEARRARADGESDAAVASSLEAHGAYQLQRVRPLRELLLALPDDLRRFELDEGMGLRAKLVFEPLAARARAECAILDDLAKHLL